MNILIVGNGFDLSHYLPTKYDHFMLVMKAIEKKDLDKPIKDVLYSPFEHPIHLFTKYFQIARAMDKKTYQMNFDDLFSELKKPQDINFIKNTKRNYKTSKINLAEEKIKQIQKQLNKNNWYQYFKNHVEEIKTWIDFEQKIDECLQVVNNFFEINNKNYEKQGWQNLAIRHDRKNEESCMFLSKKNCEILNFFGLVQNLHDLEQDDDFSQYSYLGASYVINKCYLYSNDANHNLNYQDIIHKLYLELEEFIDIFNFYLIEIVDNFIPVEQLEIIHSDFDFISKIYSFNYTNTYEKFYRKTKDIEFLHGRIGNSHNLVLGISDINLDFFKKFKAYGFSKYHQKLHKDTQYQFLTPEIDTIEVIRKELNQLKEKINEPIELILGESSEKYEINRFNELVYDLQKKIKKIYIWGHSLDRSDASYIKEIFSFNFEKVAHSIEVIIFYYDEWAKFELLNNLLDILGKDIVEKWMKKGWLKFEQNPDIAKLNNIEPVELSKLAEA